ncbi:hypothetical protein DSO57_1001736 [Entomophthora muscae]|uniref:Uncharacterized protein n=1 Tax=Entomophthora muscae TaxID=34485 RepID=A0ACC2SLX9_9FUNG|nr:hypothetical protein DSO57_1001736 [Entomophthora muscae]
MLEIPPAPPLPNVPPAQDFSKLGFVYITVLGLADHVVPHTGNWQSLATAVNYLARIAPIVYLAFQAWTASPAGVQPDTGMGHATFIGDCNTLLRREQVKITAGEAFRKTLPSDKKILGSCRKVLKQVRS